MEAFVKRFSDFRTVKKAAVLSHSLVVDALDYEKSTVVLSGTDVNRSDLGSWLILDGMVFYVADAKPDSGQVTLTLVSPLDAFQRPVEFFTQPNHQTVGGFIADQLTEHWKDCDDSAYAMPYLEVSDSDTTPFAQPELDSSGCYELHEYCRLMRKSYRTAVHFENGGSSLICKISSAPAARKNIPFNDGKSQLQKVTYSTAGLAKVTAIQDIDTGERTEDGDAVYIRERTTWYLSESGEISQLIPVDRATGQWGSVYVRSDEDVKAKVTEAFAKNKKSHKLEFYSTLDLDVQSECVFQVYGEILRSYISYKQKTTSDKRFYYKSGELATTASEILKGAKR